MDREYQGELRNRYLTLDGLLSILARRFLKLEATHKIGWCNIPITFAAGGLPALREPACRVETHLPCANRREREPGVTYTGTGTLSTISRSTCSACSDFFSVEA